MQGEEGSRKAPWIRPKFIHLVVVTRPCAPDLLRGEQEAQRRMLRQLHRSSPRLLLKTADCPIFQNLTFHIPTQYKLAVFSVQASLP